MLLLLKRKLQILFFRLPVDYLWSWVWQILLL